jgi:hypothetical protein
LHLQRTKERIRQGDQRSTAEPKAILDGEKNRKNAKSKLKRDAKKNEEGKLKPAQSPQIVVVAPQIVAATTRTATSSNDPQLLDEHENSNKGNLMNREPGCIYTIEY